MKINGREIGAYEDYVVFPRPKFDIIFTLKAIRSYDAFDKLCPEPKPPTVSKPGIGLVTNVEDEGYKAQMQTHNRRRNNWSHIETIRGTEGLEWDTVDYGDPTTWENFDTDLRNGGITDGEIWHLLAKIIEINGMSESKMEQARLRFLLMKAEQENQPLSSQTDERQNILSGPPQPTSESNPQESETNGKTTT